MKSQFQSKMWSWEHNLYHLCDASLISRVITIYGLSFEAVKFRGREAEELYKPKKLRPFVV